MITIHINTRKNKTKKVIAVMLMVLNTALFTTSLQAQKKISAKEIQALTEKLKGAIAGKALGEKDVKEMAKQFGIQVKSGQIKLPKQPPANDFPKVYLGDLPKKGLVGDPLTDYIKGLEKTIYTRMPEKDLKLVLEQTKEFENDPISLGKVSLAVYYNGATAEGLLLAIKAALMDTGNELNVNNLGGLLINVGAPAKAIPIFRGLLKEYPKNVMILNNMGQAFAGVGLKDSAKVYLARCVKQDAKHAQANNTIAQIAKSEGNTQKAVEAAKNSVEGGLNEGAMDIIDKYDQSGYAYNFLAKPKDLPDYFNEYEFKKPSNQISVLDAATIYAEREQFQEQIKMAKSQLSEASEAEKIIGERMLDESMKRMQAQVIATGRPPQDFMNISGFMAAKILPNKYIQKDLPNRIREEEKKFAALAQEERMALDIDTANIKAKIVEMLAPYNCGEGRSLDCLMIEKIQKQGCKDLNARIDLYLKNCEAAADDYDKKVLYMAREIFHFNSRWKYMVAPNEHLGNHFYYLEAMNYLNNINKIMKYNVLEPVCIGVEKFSLHSSVIKKWEPICPINYQIDAGVLSLKANCKDVSITMKPGKNVKFNYKKTFKTGQSTLSVIGYFDPGFETKDKKHALKGEIYEALYITINKDGSFADTGVRMGAQAVAKTTIGSEVFGGEKGFEASVGVNSGFTAGLKGMDGLGNDTIGGWFK